MKGRDALNSSHMTSFITLISSRKVSDFTISLSKKRTRTGNVHIYIISYPTPECPRDLSSWISISPFSQQWACLFDDHSDSCAMTFLQVDDPRYQHEISASSAGHTRVEVNASSHLSDERCYPRHRFFFPR